MEKEKKKRMRYVLVYLVEIEGMEGVHPYLAQTWISQMHVDEALLKVVKYVQENAKFVKKILLFPFKPGSVNSMSSILSWDNEECVPVSEDNLNIEKYEE